MRGNSLHEIIESIADATAAEREILSAWREYQITEKYGLDFGKVCCKWRDKVKSKGGGGTKGQGLVQLLDELSIPKSTAYWWIDRYEVSIGKKKRTLESLMSSESEDWYTPKHVIEKVICTLGQIDLDPCSELDKEIPAKKHFTKDDDGLSKEWLGRVYMNPPYGDAISNWTKKLIKEYDCGNVTEAIALVPARVDTEWFRPFEQAVFVSGRLKFSGCENSAPFPSAVLYLGKRWEVFKSEFKEIGEPWRKDSL